MATFQSNGDLQSSLIYCNRSPETDVHYFGEHPKKKSKKRKGKKVQQQEAELRSGRAVQFDDIYEESAVWLVTSLRPFNAHSEF